MSTTSKRTSPPSSSSSSARTPTKRILTELSSYAQSPSPLIPALAPLSSSNLFSLLAILSGSSLPFSSGYASGRWLVRITLPSNYPVGPPKISFVTKVCHANVAWRTGDVCLDVLGERWTPILGVVGALEAVVRLLGEPGPESPLNVDVAALVRGGDWIGARALVGFYCEEERYEGGLEEEVEGER